MITKNLKIIDEDADILYKKYKSLQVATDRAKKELMEHIWLFSNLKPKI